MTTHKFLLLAGDGIGPEVMAEVEKVINYFAGDGVAQFEIEKGLVGGCAYDAYGVAISETDMDLARAADAVIFGASADRNGMACHMRFGLKPELLRLRKDLDLYANLRPAICYPALASASSLKPEVVEGLDIMIVRELTGGVARSDVPPPGTDPPMQNLTPEGLRIVTDAAKRHGVSLDGALVLLDALARGNGRQAQFNHPDLGGMGQWSQGGMIMIGDMFNQGLKYRVDALCNELAGILHVQPLTDSKAESSQSQTQSSGGEFSLFVAGAGSASQWWPAELGSPASTGAQNDLRYACFPGSRRTGDPARGAGPGL